MPDADRRAQVRHIAADERKLARKRDQAEPACWSWPAPAAGTGSGTGTLSPGTDGLEFLANWQDGRCAICGSSPKALVTDHDHLTGLVRGLLCQSCNTAEGYAGECSKGMIASYRRRHPAMILGLAVPYVDPWTGQATGHRTEGFDPWQDTPPGHCWRCYAGPSQPCDCLPAFRLNPRLVIAAVLAVFLTARAAGIKDARRMYGSYIPDPLPSAEDHFVRDLLLRPKTADFEDRWLGGADNATNWSAITQCGEGVILDRALTEMLSTAQAMTGIVDVQVPAVVVLISALGQAARYAIENDYMPTAMICANLLAQYGLELRGLGNHTSSHVTLDAKDLRLTAAVLHLTADRLEDRQWKPLNGEDRFAASVIRVLRNDAQLATQLLNSPPVPG